MSEPELDLFGMPRADERRRPQGRPPHVPTNELRCRVREMHLAGQTQPTIAKAIGLTVPTLTRHYRLELESRSQGWRNLKGATDETA